jgi:hypothetical protein
LICEHTLKNSLQLLQVLEEIVRESRNGAVNRVTIQIHDKDVYSTTSTGGGVKESSNSASESKRFTSFDTFLEIALDLA